ncbi:Conidiation protein 6-domain-containing protein [Coprinopsis sp. MPI-PUGE-AT-0042]|nr:Conidiation protein 6-domain-containing protein [Coprinopsis sp. MPI-PUGE-AT-0042]
MSTEKDPRNVARGLKAAINNPNVSEEAKEHDRERLREMGEELPEEEVSSTTHNTHSSSKKASADELNIKPNYKKDEDLDEVITGDDEHTHRVLGGYKATLKNPNVGEAAKEHAKEVLEQAGEI